ncbi:hypothetical protein [Mesorhizobium loti]|uniref:hypothetical protein n=1 Tax=Rhizobium loti TaxID=381 RepID=UPI0004788A2D|nr:hypothetical protein [Mesorhizobium loti]
MQVYRILAAYTAWMRAPIASQRWWSGTTTTFTVFVWLIRRAAWSSCRNQRAAWTLRQTLAAHSRALDYPVMMAPVRSYKYAATMVVAVMPSILSVVVLAISVLTIVVAVLIVIPMVVTVLAAIVRGVLVSVTSAVVRLNNNALSIGRRE